ncbi:MAG TPA: endolytic transglycosylase MltG [Acidimicrobiales bacterium]|nr:endolytic transglycosylase MltG [Acidimicrobiales bacterium]
MTGGYDTSEDATGDAPDGHDYEPFPRERRRGCLGKLVGIFAVLVVLGLVGGFLAWSAYQKQVDPAGPPGEPVKLTVPLGSSTQRIGALMDDAGVITSADVFRYYIRLNGGGPFQAGEYTLARNMSMAEAIEVLEKGPDLKFERLTVREGLVLPQIAAAVAELEGRSAEAFLAAAESGQVRSKFQPQNVTKLEGLLLPETYNVEPKDAEPVLLQRMVASFDAVAEEVGIGDAQAKVGLTPYEAIVVASLIERETRFDDERAKVAQVIYNRLARGQKLEIDATVIYALGKSAESDVRVLLEDLKTPSPFNTYFAKGLPPGPIAAPSRASLEAAVNPEQHDFLFYVVTEKSGRHSFARTFSEHQANIRKAEAAGLR